MAGEFRAMAAELRLQSEEAERARAAAEAAAEQKTRRLADQKIACLRAKVLPILSQAKQEFAEEGVASELDEHFAGSFPFVTFRCWGRVGSDPVDVLAPEPHSRKLFLSVDPDGRIEARISSHFAEQPISEAEGLGDLSPDDPHIGQWLGGKLRMVLQSYFDNIDGKSV